MKISALLLSASILFAAEARLSCPNVFLQQCLKLQTNTLQDVYIGLIVDESAYLGKSGVFALKTNAIELLMLQKPLTFELQTKNFELYNFKIIKETNDYMLISRANWYNTLPISAQQSLSK